MDKKTTGRAVDRRDEISSEERESPDRISVDKNESVSSYSSTKSDQISSTETLDSYQQFLGGHKPTDGSKQSEVLKAKNVPQKCKVISFTGTKLNFGGYINKLTEKTYFHASAQTTIRPPLPDPAIRLECRETQTIEVCSHGVQSTKDNSTQMTKIGVYVSNANDKILIPRRYVTADKYMAKFISKIIIVQKQIRCFLARKRVSRMRREYQEHLNWLKMQSELRQQEKENRIYQKEMRQQHPKSKADFNMLYSAVEQWRKEKYAELEKSVSGPELKAALCLLGEKESKLLKIIHQHKLIAQEVNKDDGFRNTLSRTSASKKWKNSDGKVTQVYTTTILRAKQLQDLYHTLSLHGFNEDERLDVLITLKRTVMEYDSTLTREIMDLADREADLIMRSIKEKNLGGLRQRLLVLFMQFIRTPKFNPEYKTACRDPKVKKDSDSEKQICQSCGWLYTLNKFIVLGNSPLIRRCQRCAQNENEANIRNENSVFIYMLAHLRVEEGKLDATRSVAFLLNVRDFRYLVEVVWNSQSLMSAEDDLYNLVMCRWNKELDWSPWNCILLTNEEAISHYKVKSLTTIYDANLVQKVKQKHMMAKNYFNQIYAASRAFSNVRN